MREILYFKNIFAYQQSVENYGLTVLISSCAKLYQIALNHTSAFFESKWHTGTTLAARTRGPISLLPCIKEISVNARVF